MSLATERWVFARPPTSPSSCPTCEAAETADDGVALHVLEQHRQYDLDYDA